MKKVFALLLAVAMVLALSACGGGTAEKPAETTVWKFACSATDNTCWADMGRVFGKYINEKTNGAYDVEVYAQDQLTNGSQTEGIQATMDGTINLCAHSNLIMSNFDQRLNVVSLPFIFDNYEEVDKILDGEGLEALRPIVESMGLHLLGVAENGFRHPTNNKRAIASVADMKGLVIRVAGANVLKEAYADWGANVTTANWSEVYTGLQTGTYEGQENPLPTADGASMADVQTNVTYWTGVYDCIFFCMNKDLYDSLTPEMQALVDEAGAYAAADQRQKEREADLKILQEWKDKGIVVTELTPEAADEFKTASAGVKDVFVQQCVELGFDQAEVAALVDIFTK